MTQHILYGKVFFSRVAEVALEMGIPADTFDYTREVHPDGASSEEDSENLYEINITSSFLNSKENPGVIVVNLYKNGFHAQQTVGVAHWDLEGKPKMIGLDGTVWTETSESFNLLLVGHTAIESLVNWKPQEEALMIPVPGNGPGVIH